jgi:hypothetical protein
LSSDNITPLSIGLIVDSKVTSKYVYELAEWAKDQNILNISHLIIQSYTKPNMGRLHKALQSLINNGFFSLLSQVIFRIILIFEKYFLLLWYPRHKDHFNKFDIGKLVANSILITPQISKSGFVYRYSAEDVAKVKRLNLDLLIRCGSGILRGEILNSSKLGIISFHHADNRINRGGPAGFWEVYLKQDITGFIIQRLAEELDGGEVFYRGSCDTKFFYLFNQAELFKKSNYHLMRMLTQIAETRTLPSAKESQPYFNKLYTRPSITESLLYTLKLALIIVRKVTDIILKKDYRWGVAFSRSDWINLVMWRSIKIKNPAYHFLADPFVITKDNRDYCFVEDFNYKTKTGCIAVYQLNDKAAHRIGEAIIEPFHMSFPYLFEFEGQQYMCPETNVNKDIRLYRCIRFPLKWELSQVLMDNVRAFDTMIFEKDGAWWLMTNIDPVCTGDHNNLLFIFYADSPLSKNWTPHPKNPIAVDGSKARNGGLLRHEEFIYRVSQKQGFNTYGKGFVINKICVLNIDDYVEEEITSIEPNFFPNLSGTHHLHSNRRISVFDFKSLSKITY